MDAGDGCGGGDNMIMTVVIFIVIGNDDVVELTLCPGTTSWVSPPHGLPRWLRLTWAPFPTTQPDRLVTAGNYMLTENEDFDFE